MNGPEHYREAERLLRDGIDATDAARAQGHATLALAAATAAGRTAFARENFEDIFIHGDEAWNEAIS